MRLGDGRDDGQAEPAAPALGGVPVPVHGVGAGGAGAAGTVADPRAGLRLAQVGGGVVLEVADAGPGMAASDAARAFDRFSRGAERHNGGPVPGPAVGYGPGSARAASHDSGNGSGDAAESGGSGLGLAIVAAIAQAHGGQATLESAPGRGTRVRVWLPAAPAAAPRPAPAPRLPRGGHRAPVPLAAPLPGQPVSRPPNCTTTSVTARVLSWMSWEPLRPGWAGARTGSRRRAHRR